MLSAKDGCFSFLPLVPPSRKFHSEVQCAQLCKITTWLALHDDHVPICCTDFANQQCYLPPSPQFLYSLGFFFLIQQLLCGASTIAAEFFNLFPGAECLEEISDLQKHFGNLSAVLL